MELINIVESSMLKYGLLIVFLIVALEYANVPLPSEIVLPFVGFFVSTGVYSLGGAIFVSVVAGIVGSLSNYYLGYFGGEPCTNSIIKRFPKTEKSIVFAKDLLTKYGKASVVLARFLPLARTIISIPAGMIKMNVFIFTAYTAVGITIWNSILIGAGAYLGDRFYVIADVLKQYYLVILPVLVVIFVYILFRKRETLKSLF